LLKCRVQNPLYLHKSVNMFQVAFNISNSIKRSSNLSIGKPFFLLNQIASEKVRDCDNEIGNIFVQIFAFRSFSLQFLRVLLSRCDEIPF